MSEKGGKGVGEGAQFGCEKKENRKAIDRGRTMANKLFLHPQLPTARLFPGRSCSFCLCQRHQNIRLAPAEWMDKHKRAQNRSELEGAKRESSKTERAKREAIDRRDGCCCEQKFSASSSLPPSSFFLNLFLFIFISKPQLPAVFNTVIEVPTGSKVKYRLCERTGVLRVEKVVGASLIFPFNYGFVPQTIAADEDALDVLVLMSEPVHPGSFLRAKPIGLMTMVMAAATPRGHTPRKANTSENVEFGGFNTPRGGAGGGGEGEAAGEAAAAPADAAAAATGDGSSPMDDAVYAAADAQAAAARAATAAAPPGKIVPVARGDVSTATTPRIDTGDGRGLLSLTSADLGLTGVSDDKVIAVHADDPNFNSYNDIADLPPHRLQEIKRFVLDYSSAEKKGLKVSVDSFEGPEAAMRALEKAASAYREVYLPKRPRTG